MIGVDQQDLSGDARAFAKKYGMSYPIVRDGPGHVVAKYGLTGVPETFFVGRSGKLVGPHVEGRVSEAPAGRGHRGCDDVVRALAVLAAALVVGVPAALASERIRRCTSSKGS